MMELLTNDLVPLDNIKRQFIEKAEIKINSLHVVMIHKNK